MGNSNSNRLFTKIELSEYENCTYFSKNQILEIYNIFISLGKKSDKFFSKNSILPLESVKSLKSIQFNPFRDEIVSIFASDESGHTFDDFVDMCSAFSPYADVKVKEQIVFHIFDFTTADGVLTMADMKNVISKMCNEKNITDIQIHSIADKIFQELDVGGTNSINLADFGRLIDRVPDFGRKYSFRVV